jgi:hypothetical protein
MIVPVRILALALTATVLASGAMMLLLVASHA